VKTAIEHTALSDASVAVVDDLVKVMPTRPGGRDGYLARVRKIELAREHVEVTVAGIGVSRARDAVRTVAPSRLRRPTAAELRTIGADR
jgi:hypothetical protein